jgi:hypothetical protein
MDEVQVEKNDKEKYISLGYAILDILDYSYLLWDLVAGANIQNIVHRKWRCETAIWP